MDERIVETEAGPEAEGLRLDQFLTGRFTYLSRTAWQKSIDAGQILLNGHRTRPSRVLHAGDRIRYLPPQQEEPPADLSFRVIAEDPHWICVDKPGNLPCHPAGVFFRHTLWKLLTDRFGGTFHIATRLDRETSGIVLAARDPGTAKRFTDLLMRNHQVRKVYYAIVYGEMRSSLEADGFLSADPDSSVGKKRRFTAEEVPESEHARTVFHPVSTNGILTLVRAEPETGRLHQIRATLCSLGFPLVGDKLYGPDDTMYLRFIHDELTPEDRSRLILSRQALHAGELSIGDLHFVSPLPPDMAELVSDFRPVQISC